MIEFIKHKKYEEKTFAEIDIFDFFIGRKKGSDDLLCMKIPQINMEGYLDKRHYVGKYTKNAIEIDFLSSFCDKDLKTYTPPKDAGSNMRYLGFNGDEVVRPLKSEIKIHHRGTVV